jgi:hypothetical protein
VYFKQVQGLFQVPVMILYKTDTRQQLNMLGKKTVCTSNQISSNLQVSPNTIRAPLQAAACIFFTPLFSAFYNQERFILQTIYVLKRKCGLQSAVYNQEWFQIKRGL